MQNKTPTVLCVDDEANILSALKRVLRREGCRFLSANTAAEAMDILSRENVNVIICDQRMPEMDGVTLLKNVKETYPDIIRITLTGFTDIDTIKEAINQGHIYKFLMKPWDDDNLILEIRQALKQSELINANRELNRKISVQNEKLKQFNEQLENLVRERTEEIVIRNKALELSQAILFDLPTPIIGLDSDGMVAMKNHAIDRMFEGIVNIPIGALIDDFMPMDISQHIHDILAKDGNDSTKTYSIKGMNFELQCVPLSGKFKGNGIILSFRKL